MTDNIDTATVQTLTAEVRVLMVGSRQITQSVAQQLDTVPLESLTVFGRVNLRNRTSVIGSAPDGSLALADYPIKTQVDRFQIHAMDVGTPITVCLNSYPQAKPPQYADLWSPPMISMRLGPYLIDILPGAYDACDGHELVYDQDTRDWVKPKCDTIIDLHGQRTRIQSMLHSHLASETIRIDREKAAANAPLIVLAGLR